MVAHADRPPKGCPPFKVIPGTRFMVDGFRWSSDWCAHYFLTHGHSDHYTGLKDTWSHGIIYCSHITARVVQCKLGLPPERFCVLPMRREVTVEGVRVTLVDANHCPGAVQILFQLPDGKRFLHCGDMRYHPSMQQDVLLSRWRGCDAMYADTTYCDPKYVFPPQHESIQYVVRTLLQAMRATPAGKTLCVVSTYGIGKERILAAVAAALHCKMRGAEERQIYVTERKLEVLKCMDLDYIGIFTCDPKKSNVHVKGMDFLGDTFPYFRPNFTNMEALRAEFGADAVVGIVPTGWMYQMKKTTYAQQSKEACTVHLVPYSEHSSYSELREYVRWLEPVQVVPTVGVDGIQGSKKDAGIVKHFRNLVNETASKANFLKRMQPAASESSQLGSDTPPDVEIVDLVDECTPPTSGEAAAAAASASLHTDLDDSHSTPSTPQPPSQDASGLSDATLQLRAVLGEAALTAAHARLLLRASGGDVAVAVNRFMDHGLAGLGSATTTATGVSSRDGSGRAASTSGRGSSNGGGGGGAKRAPPSTPGSASKGKRAKQKGVDSGAPAANQRTIQSFFAKPSPTEDPKAKGKTVAVTGAGSSVQSSIATSSGRGSAGAASGSDGAGCSTQYTRTPTKARSPPYVADGGASAAAMPTPVQSPGGSSRLMSLHSSVDAERATGSGSGSARPSHRGSRAGGPAVSVDAYDAREGACWADGEPAPYLHLARAFEAMEKTTAKLKIGDLLTNMFRSLLALSPDDLRAAVYLTINKLAPDYEGVDQNLGPSTVRAAIAEATGVSSKRLGELHKEGGDWGDVAQSCRSSQGMLVAPAPLTVAGVYGSLRKIADERGDKSTARKQATVMALLRRCRECETRYVVRTLIQNLRVGANSATVMAALARAAVWHDAEAAHLAAMEAHHGDDNIDAALPPRRPTAALLKAKLAAAEAAMRQAFALCPSLEAVVPALLEGGIAALVKRCSLTPGVPVRCMLAKVATGGEDVLRQLKHQAFVAEYKYDGMRAQLHLLASGDVRVYSRNCEDRTASFPDVVALVKALLGDDCVETEGGQSRTLIVDAELVAVDAKTGRLRAFQELATRKRGETTVAEVTVQVCVFAFDLLMLDGEVLATQPFRCRRARLRQLVEARADASRLRLACALELTPEQTDDADDAGVSGQPPASVGEEAEDRSAAEIGVAVEVTEERGSTSERLHRFLLASLAAGCEGLMLKTLEGVYEPGKRADTWLKMKKDYVEGMADSLDLVVIGAWYGDGRKTGWYSPFLMACWNAETEEYQSMCRCMSGFTDEFYQRTFDALQPHLLPSKPAYYSTHESPSVWFAPTLVWEIRGADFTVSPTHTAAFGHVHADRGVSLRFPRFLRARDDKAPEDATGPDEIVAMFHKQANKWQADAPVAQAQARAAAVERVDEEEPRSTPPHASLSSATVVDDDEFEGGGLDDDASKQ